MIGLNHFLCMALRYYSQSVFVYSWYLPEYLISKFGLLMSNWLTYRLKSHCNVKIYIGGPAVDFDLEDDMGLQLLKPLYRLAD